MALRISPTANPPQYYLYNAVSSLAETIGKIACDCIAFLGDVLSTAYLWAKQQCYGIQPCPPNATTQPPLPTLPPAPTLLPPRPALRAMLITAKLQRQYDRAQTQAKNEQDKHFKYASAPLDRFESPFWGIDVREESGTLNIAGHKTGFCHFRGRRDNMEDEHVATAFNLNVRGQIYPVQLFAVLDGHGGKEAAVFVKEHLQQMLTQTLIEFCPNGITQEGIRDALKQTFPRLSTAFKNKSSGTTATVAMILDGHLWTANVGDSRTILDNGIQLSEDAKPSDPYYQKRIHQLGGEVSTFRGVPRVGCDLAVARAIGDHLVRGISAAPKITDVPLADLPPNTYLILACDGIYDVASTRQIAKAVRDHKDLSVEVLARDIVHSAYKSWSNDNVTAMVVKL